MLIKTEISSKRDTRRLRLRLRARARMRAGSRAILIDSLLRDSRTRILHQSARATQNRERVRERGHEGARIRAAI